MNNPYASDSGLFSIGRSRCERRPNWEIEKAKKEKDEQLEELNKTRERYEQNCLAKSRVFRKIFFGDIKDCLRNYRSLDKHQRKIERSLQAVEKAEKRYWEYFNFHMRVCGYDPDSPFGGC